MYLLLLFCRRPSALPSAVARREVHNADRPTGLCGAVYTHRLCADTVDGLC
jgi:hypothetical protein